MICNHVTVDTEHYTEKGCSNKATFKMAYRRNNGPLGIGTYFHYLCETHRHATLEGFPMALTKTDAA